jgi:hypothetical protein
MTFYCVTAPVRTGDFDDKFVAPGEFKVGDRDAVVDLRSTDTSALVHSAHPVRTAPPAQFKETGVDPRNSPALIGKSGNGSRTVCGETCDGMPELHDPRIDRPSRFANLARMPIVATAAVGFASASLGAGAGSG